MTCRLCARARCERKFPVRLDSSGGTRILGAIKSHDLPGGVPPMLSHKRQGELGIILDTRDGIAWPNDLPNE